MITAENIFDNFKFHTSGLEEGGSSKLLMNQG